MPPAVPYTDYQFRVTCHDEATEFLTALKMRGVRLADEFAWRHDTLDIGGGESVRIPDLIYAIRAVATLDELCAVAYHDIDDGALIGETLALTARYTGVRTYRSPDPGLVESLRPASGVA